MIAKTERNYTWHYHFLPKLLTTLVFVVLMLAGCKSSTGPGDDPEPNPDPDPSPTPASITSFSASDELISAGEAVMLSWEVSGDEPLTLTLEPGGTDVTGETSAEVAPDEETTYRLIAENEGGNDEAEVTVSVIAAGETALEVMITGLPGGAEANIAVTDHDTLMQWIPAGEALTMLPPGTYTVAAAGVQASGTTYLPDEDVQTVSVSGGEFISVQISYSEASGSLYATDPDVEPGTLATR